MTTSVKAQAAKLQSLDDMTDIIETWHVWEIERLNPFARPCISLPTNYRTLASYILYNRPLATTEHNVNQR